jgi:hypothetical protein
MDKIINLRLLTVGNVVAIGAILIFWAYIAYALNVSFAGTNS